MKILTLIIAMNVLTFGCSNENMSQTTNVEFIEIAKGFLAGNGAENIPKQNIVINSEVDWNTLKTKMNSVNNVTDSFSETEIDFSEFLIVAAFEEVKNEGEYHLSIIEIVKNSENIFVKTELKSPSDQNTIQLITQPYYIVKIPKIDLPVIFQ